MDVTDRGRFLRGLIGRPYARLGESPQAYDCYGLARCVQSAVFEVSLPHRNAWSLSTARQWRPTNHLVDGSLVFMFYGSDRHVGVWLKEGGVIHAVEPAGWSEGDPRPAVVFESIDCLRLRNFLKIRFYTLK